MMQLLPSLALFLLVWIAIVILTVVVLGHDTKLAVMRNERGYIRCVDGHWIAGNFDIFGENKDQSPVMNITRECKAWQ